MSDWGDDGGPDPYPEDQLEAPVQEPTLITERLLREVTQEDDFSKMVAVDLHDKNIHQIQTLERLVNLRTLDLSFNRIAKIEGLEKVVRLKELKLYDNKISNITGLQALSALHTLDLTSNTISHIEGLLPLRSLKVLRLAYNKISTLDGLGRSVTGLEILDVSNNYIKDLTGLSSCTSLQELNVTGNQLVNLKGLGRCQQLQELHASDNVINTMQGLKACATCIDVLDLSGNKLTSLDGLADGCTRLTELYLANNAIADLAGIAAKAPALETLDVAYNRLAGVEALAAALQPLSELTSMRLVGNPLPNDYESKLLEALSQLDSVDAVERPRQPEVWVNPEEEKGEMNEVDEWLAQNQKDFEPSEEEMHAFKLKMNIRSDVPAMGRPTTASRMARPPTASGRPASSLLRTSVSLRPGTASLRPGSSTGRPGTAGGPIKDIMMHQRPPSARTGGAGRLLTPDDYEKAVSSFKNTMDSYSLQLRSVLSSVRQSLQMNVYDAAAQLKVPGAEAARRLPSIPLVPELPPSLAPVKGSKLKAPVSKPGLAGTAAAGAPNGRVIGLVRDPALDDPEVDAALSLYRKLFPNPADAASGASTTSTSGAAASAAAGPGSRAVLGAKGPGVTVETGEDIPDDREEELIGSPEDDGDDGPLPAVTSSTSSPAVATPSAAHGAAVSAGAPSASGTPSRPLSAGRSGQLKPRMPAAGAVPGGASSPAAARRPASPLTRSPAAAATRDPGSLLSGAGATATTPKRATGGASSGAQVLTLSSTSPAPARPLSAGRSGPKTLVANLKPRMGGMLSGSAAAAGGSEVGTKK